MQEASQQTREMVEGKTIKFFLPDGNWVVIREQNGDDDDTLSNPVLAENGHHLNTFIAGIIIDSSMGGKLTPEQILDMKIRNKYAILFKSRVFSLGHMVEFEYNWGKDNGGKVLYEDDISRYIFDYEKPFEEFPLSPEDEGYDEQRLIPYVNGKEDKVELALTSGKVIRYNYLNGHSERYLLSLPAEKQTKNAELKARNIEQEGDDGKWRKVETFRYFNSKDMQEIRESVNLHDQSFNPLMDIENPKTGEVVNFPVIASPDFFYPREI